MTSDTGVPPVKSMDNETELLSVIDVEKRTTRGRACPRCGGKIIPSQRAVYQSSGDPNAVFPAWQCERCGYEELVARAIKPAPKHGAPAAEKPAAAPDKKAPVAPGATPEVFIAASPGSPGVHTVPALKDKKGRALPADVNRMMDVMQPRSK